MLDVKHVIGELRQVIRGHRDQVGDFRCWVDDEVLYHRVLPELQGVTPEVPPEGVFTSFCEHYFSCRQDPNNLGTEDIPLDSRGTPLLLKYSKDLDGDLETMTQEELSTERERLLTEIRKHRSLGQLKRTYVDDQALYLTLPERSLAKTRLPPRELFLGRGCPRYNRHCQEHPADFAEGSWS